MFLLKSDPPPPDPPPPFPPQGHFFRVWSAFLRLQTNLLHELLSLIVSRNLSYCTVNSSDTHITVKMMYPRPMCPPKRFKMYERKAYNWVQILLRSTKNSFIFTSCQEITSLPPPPPPISLLQMRCSITPCQQPLILMQYYYIRNHCKTTLTELPTV